MELDFCICRETRQRKKRETERRRDGERERNE